MTRRWAALGLLLFAACARGPVTDEVTVKFAEGSDAVVITAETSFDLHSAAPAVESARHAALNGTDPWSIRFSRVSPDYERVSFERERGELARVSRSARLRADDLQRVFSDVSATFLLTRADGWSELTILPGTSSRASREQQRFFEAHLDSWSRQVARYFTAMDHLYDYLRQHPHRAEAVFGAMLSREGQEPQVTEDELALLTAVSERMEDILLRMDRTEGEAWSLGEVADLVYNPFPARMTFSAPDAKELVIEPVDLLAAITALEGRWLSPDPLAMLIREEEQLPDAVTLAAMPRRSSSSVNGSEISSAIRDHLARPKSYTLRWRD